MHTARQHSSKHHLRGLEGVLIGLLISLTLGGVVLWKFQAIIDWWHLRGYTPPAQISSIATTTTMTEYGRKLFYVNHPQLLTASTFSKHCKTTDEKTIILGCYKGGDRGIFLYTVTDERLAGVVETTAAHEMLHAGYARLSPSQRSHIDSLLENYYKNDLKDDRIKATIEAYKTSEPKDVDNEMHSVFGTEANNLPTELESYYKQYFSNRGTVVAMAEHYQAEFTTRRDQANTYDTEIDTQKPIIEANRAEIKRQSAALAAESARLDMLKSEGHITEYNAAVDSYNTAVKTYRALLERTQNQIDEYNAIIDKRNALQLETQDLTEALTDKTL